MHTKEIIPVSEYLDGLNGLLKGEKAKIIGEICNIQEYPGRSYLYFSIKDSKDGSTAKCFMWKRDFSISGLTLSEGIEVIITAYPNIYKPNGGLTMQVEMIELVGFGALQAAYEKLKKKLELEGLFSPITKRAIPDYPHRIGVITSKSGAVINDFLSNIGKYGFDILFVDSKVEGQDAVKDLLNAVETLKDKGLDVLVMMRGGGSLESFQAFNNEALVRAVASFPVPVLTGIGHDKDAPLVSMVSDKNVSTPTAVANLLNASWAEARSKVELSEEKIFSSFQSELRDRQFQIENAEVAITARFSSFLDMFKTAEKTLSSALVRIESELKHAGNQIVRYEKEMLRGFMGIFERAESMLAQSQKQLEFASPERQLALGFSIVKSEGKVLRSVKDVKKGDGLDVQVRDGIIRSITQ